MKIFSIGHSNRYIKEFVDLLQNAGVNYLIDVRRFPHSARQPQFNIEVLPKTLSQFCIRYLHLEALGGRRPPRQDGKMSPNNLWREKSFQNYADYAETTAFQTAFERLLACAQDSVSAIMCAEAQWQQCHRRIITDYLLARGVSVEHILYDRREVARLTENTVVRPDRSILYSDMPLFTQAASA